MGMASETGRDGLGNLFTQYREIREINGYSYLKIDLGPISQPFTSFDSQKAL